MGVIRGFRILRRPFHDSNAFEIRVVCDHEKIGLFAFMLQNLELIDEEANDQVRLLLWMLGK